MTRERVAPIGVVVFDMDGVLVDVRHSFRAAVVRTVAAMGGGTVDESDVLALKNAGGYNNDWDLTRELLRLRGVAASREQVIEHFHGLYRGELIHREAWMLPEALVEVLTARFRLAIFTGRPRVDAEYALRRAGMQAAFSPLIGLEDVSAAKPAPDGLYKIAAAHRDLPLLAYFGDTVDDARCAAAAGVPFYAVLASDQPYRDELAASVAAIGHVGAAPTVAEAVCQFLSQGMGTAAC